jgi:hypothetical protein
VPVSNAGLDALDDGSVDVPAEQVSNLTGQETRCARQGPACLWRVMATQRRLECTQSTQWLASVKEEDSEVGVARRIPGLKLYSSQEARPGLGWLLHLIIADRQDVEGLRIKKPVTDARPQLGDGFAPLLLPYLCPRAFFANLKLFVVPVYSLRRALDDDVAAIVAADVPGKTTPGNALYRAAVQSFRGNGNQPSRAFECGSVITRDCFVHQQLEVKPDLPEEPVRPEVTHEIQVTPSALLAKKPSLTGDSQPHLFRDTGRDVACDFAGRPSHPLSEAVLAWPPHTRPQMEGRDLARTVALATHGVNAREVELPCCALEGFFKS